MSQIKHWTLLGLLLPALAAADSVSYWSPGYHSRRSFEELVSQFAQNAVSTVAGSNLVQGAEHLGSALVDKDAAWNSPLDLPQIVNVVGSDIGAILKFPLHATDRQSRRIEVCAVNLSQMEWKKWEPIDPDLHIGYVFDRSSMSVPRMEDADSKVGEFDPGPSIPYGYCQAVYFKKNISESLAMEKLNCVSRHYIPRYYFWTYNCGGITADVLREAGLANRSEYNLGIGGTFGIHWDKKLLKQVSSECEAWISRIPELLSSLEHGDAIDEEALSLVFSPRVNSRHKLYFTVEDHVDPSDVEDGTVPTDDGFKVLPEDVWAYSNHDSIYARNITNDLAIQLVISTVRGGNPANLVWMKTHLLNKPTHPLTAVYYKARKDHQIRRQVFASLREILGTLSVEQQRVLQENYPEIARLYLDYETQVLRLASARGTSGSS